MFLTYVIYMYIRVYTHTFNFKCHKTFVLGIRLSQNKGRAKGRPYRLELWAGSRHQPRQLVPILPLSLQASRERNLILLKYLYANRFGVFIKNSEPQVSGERDKETTF